LSDPKNHCEPSLEGRRTFSRPLEPHHEEPGREKCNRKATKRGDDHNPQYALGPKEGACSKIRGSPNRQRTHDIWDAGLIDFAAPKL
jgi:hypothetical protein